MAEITISGTLEVHVDLIDLWDETLQDYISSNYSLCDVEIDSIDD